MIQLYGNLRSRALRAVWLLREMDAQFEWVPVIQAYRLADPSAPGAPFNTQSEAFLALNPMAQVPFLRDGEVALAESAAICHYIARKLGGPMGYASLAEEAESLQWAFLGVSAVETPALSILMAHHQGDPISAQGQEQRARARDALKRPLDRIEAHLQAHEWLVGERFTVADILLVECVRFALDEPKFLDQWPNLWRWLTAARARPIFQSLWAERNAEPL